VVQETLGDRARERFREALAEKTGWFGAALLEPRFVAPHEGAVADALRALAGDGAQVIAVAGTKAMDLLDPAFRALAALGAPIERHGVPAHPGSLFWLARLGDVPVVGVPTCGLFSQATVFDLLLPRLLAGERLGTRQLAALGHGGFLTRDMAFRFPPYRASAARGALD
jgi:molybdopterin biosynthesis enzyme